MNGNGHRPDPSPAHREVKKAVGSHEFTAGFYPGFASSIKVNGVSVYEQKTDGPHPFVLPSGSVRPMSTCAVDLCSSRGYRVTLHLDDPDHCIDHIEVFLRDPKKNGGGVTAMSEGGPSDDGDTVTIENRAVTCPPLC